MSEQTQHTQLWEAVRRVQADAKTLPKDATNPHFKSKFTPLDTIVERVGPLLAEHGLVWTTLPSQDESTGRPVLRYRLVHAGTGQALSDAVPLFPAKDTMQDLGSAITYARRYALTSVLNLVADEDTDGGDPKRAQQRSPTPTQAPQSQPPLADSAIEFLRRAKKGSGVTDERFRHLLVAAGAANVPAGPVTKATMQRLSSEQASALTELLEKESAAA